MSQQPIWQIICNSSKKKIIIIIRVFVSRIKLLIGTLVEKVPDSIQLIIYLCVISGISVLKCSILVNSISFSHQSSIAKTPLIYSFHISQKISFPFFLHAELTSFSSPFEDSVSSLRYCSFHQYLASQLTDGVKKPLMSLKASLSSNIVL